MNPLPDWIVQMNQTLEVSLFAMIIPVVALMLCVYLERRNKVSTDGVLELTESASTRPEFKLIAGRKQQLAAKAPTDMPLQERQGADSKKLGRYPPPEELPL
jgi:hypothetical protein